MSRRILLYVIFDGPKDDITGLISLPCSHESVVSWESRFHHIALSMELSDFLRIPRFGDAVRRTTVIISDRNSTLLNGSRRPGRGVESGNTGCVCAQSFNESPLWNEFESNFARKIELFKVFVSILPAPSMLASEDIGAEELLTLRGRTTSSS